MLDVFDSIVLAYPQKGHTHGPLDGTFGQCCVKIGNEQFDSAGQVVSILQSFLDDAVLEAGASCNKVAYKLDESPSWETWWDELQLQMGNLTGPLAPHWFHICSRKDLDATEKDSPETSWPNAPSSRPGDIVCAIKDRMASGRAHQVALLMPERDIKLTRQLLSVQPSGLHPRRHLKRDDARKIIARAKEVFDEQLINQAAYDFLISWASGTAVKQKRPDVYHFLNHRCNDPAAAPAASQAVPRYLHPGRQEPRQIQIHRVDGSALPLQDEEEADDAEHQQQYVALDQ